MVKVKDKKSKADSLRVKKVIKKVLNPFEVHVNKEKLKVLGRKSKNDRGLPGISRAKAIKKRKNTLGHEFSLRHKSNKFVDRRIGESNASMTVEDRITARFSAEQRRLHGNKQSIYNLEDTLLTHRGQTLNEIEKFEDPRSEDEFSDDESGQKRGGKLEANFVADAHFGGGLFKKSTEEGTKSRKELIEQLIVESKKRKLEKQKEREVTIEMTEKLDSEWKDLLPLVNKSNANKEEPYVSKSDDYDIVMRQLKFEARGTPSDRLKSENEIAVEEKQKLEKLENDRLSRMQCGTDDKIKNKHRSADDLDDGLYIEAEPDFTLRYDAEGNLINSAQILEDGNNAPQEDNDANAEEENASNDEDESDDDEEDDSLSDLKADETSSDEISETEENNKDVENNEKEIESDQSETEEIDIKTKMVKDSNVQIVDQDMKCNDTIEKNHDSLKISKGKKKSLGNLALHETTTKCNESLTKSKDSSSSKQVDTRSDETLAKNETTSKSNEIMKNTKEQDVKSDETLAHKIKMDLLKRKKIMEKAAKELPYTFKMPSNYEELEELLNKQSPEHQSIIIERMIKCNHPSLSDGNKEKLSTLLAYLLQYVNDVFSDTNSTNISMKFLILDRLTPYIYDLCQMNRGNAYTCFMEVIKEKQSDFRKHKMLYPGLDTLVFFKLISLLFPTSDFRHQVVSPALVFISQLLTRCKVKSKTDITSGLFLVTLILEYGVLSKRFLPAALNFLTGVIHMTIPKNSIQILKIVPPFKSHGANSLLLLVEDKIEILPDNCSLVLNSSDFTKGIIDDSFKLRTFYISLKLLNEFYVNLDSLAAAELIFRPHIELLALVPIENYPSEIKHQYDSTYSLIQKCKESMMDYLQIEKPRPKALRLYEPSIEKILYDTKRHRPMSKEKADHEKLVHKYKREMKGALREIRRDKSYLAGLQIKKQIASDMERKAKVKQIYAEASIQQGELNSLKRKK